MVDLTQDSAPALLPIKLPVRWSHWLILGSILLGATALRVNQLGRTSFWYDELCSVLYARGETQAIFDFPQGYFEHAPALTSQPGTRGWRDVWLGFDTTPPLYPSVLRLWWMVFGQTDVECRALSVVFSVLTVAAVFDVARLLLGPTAALWAAALCAASPPMVQYAQEARCYAMLALIATLICDVALRISRSGGAAKKYFLLWLLCATALLTHHFIAGGLIAVVAYAMIAFRRRERWMTLLCVVTALVVELWAVPKLIAHPASVHRGIDWLAEPGPELVLNTLRRIVWLPIDFLILPMNDSSPALIPAAFLLLLPPLLSRKLPGLLLTGLWPLGIIGLVAASDLYLGHGALGYVRYTLAAAPMVFVNFVAMAWLGGKWSQRTLPLLTVAGALLAVPQSYADQLWLKPEGRELARDVSRHVGPGDVLVVASRHDMGLYAADVAYMGIDYYNGPLPYAVAILDGPPDQQLVRSIWSHKHVWLVKSFDSMGTGAQFSPRAYFGPCRLTPAGQMHLFAGRLFLMEKIVPTTEANLTPR